MSIMMKHLETAMKLGESYTIKELLDDRERLDALYADRKKRYRVIHISTWIIIIASMIQMVAYLIEWKLGSMAFPLAVLAVFFCLDQGFEQERRILELAKALRSDRDKESEP